MAPNSLSKATQPRPPHCLAPDALRRCAVASLRLLLQAQATPTTGADGVPLTWQELRLAAEAGFEELLQQQEAEQMERGPSPKEARRGHGGPRAAAYISPMVAKKQGTRRLAAQQPLHAAMLLLRMPL